MTTAMANPPRQLTPEQGAAIDTRDCSVALSAGAGCGKTFVLTERFLSYFEPGVPGALRPDQLGQLIAITFTERAAREMRDRIRQKCYGRLMQAEGDAAEYWIALERGLDSARVSTIHSFCGALLRSHAVEAGVDPRFRVLEQAQADTLLAESIDDALRRLLAARDEATLASIVRYGLDALRSMVTELVARREDFQPWLDCTPEQIVKRWQTYHTESVMPAALRRVATCPAAQLLVATLLEYWPSHGPMLERREIMLDKLSRWREAKPASDNAAQELAELREAAKVQGCKADCWPSGDVYATVRDQGKKLRDEIDKVSDLITFDQQTCLLAAQVGQQVLGIAASIAAAYAQEKQRLAVLNFGDLLARAHRLLIDPEHAALRKRLSSQTRLLLVDEFQDTNPLQVELVSALCGADLAAGKLFLVGDFKQSIYRFLGADPGVFRRVREQILPRGRLPLTLNFRSQPAILHFVNGLFSEEFGDLYESLQPSRQQINPTPAVEFLWAPAENADGKKERKDELRRREADWIARRLRALIDGREPIVWDKASPKHEPKARPLEPGDVALLFRALSDVAYYEEALRQYGLDYYLVGGHAFYAQQEIFDLLNLLRTLASPADVVSLTGVLRSPFFSLKDETLFWLAQHPAGLSGGLFAERLPEQLEEHERLRAAFAAETLADLRAKKDRLPIAELINEALARTGYDAILLAEFLGERKLANLRKLINQARSFGRGGLFSLADFISQLANFVAEQPHEALAATHPEATNVVRLMTIHQSKGLEFPLVVVPDMERSNQGHRPSVGFTRELGPLVRIAGSDGEKRRVPFDWHLMAEAEEDLAEIHRLLYVAATRAADYLILSSGVSAINAAEGPWRKLLERRFDLTSGQFLGDCHEAERPQVRVISTLPELPGKPPKPARPKGLARVIEQTLAEAETRTRSPAPHVGPIAQDRGGRRQYSFSRLSGALKSLAASSPDDDDELRIERAPLAAADDALTLGSLVHAALAEMNFAVPGDLPALVRRRAERIVEATPEHERLAIELLQTFAASRRAAALAHAGASHAELEFLLAWPPESAVQGGIYLSGVIDRLYQDPVGNWHILDFKTNRVTPDTLAEIAAGYEMQMLVYSLAAERILGSAPQTASLHFLRTGDEFPFVWNSQSRNRARKLVHDAIRAASQT